MRRRVPVRSYRPQLLIVAAPCICRAKGCAAQSSMIGDPCLVVAPLSLTSFLVFQVCTASLFFVANSRIFGKRLRRPLNFGDFALAAQETRVSGMAGRYAQ